MMPKVLLLAQSNNWMPYFHRGFQISQYKSNLLELNGFPINRYNFSYLIIISSPFFFTWTLQHSTAYKVEPIYSPVFEKIICMLFTWTEVCCFILSLKLKWFDFVSFNLIRQRFIQS